MQLNTWAMAAAISAVGLAALAHSGATGVMKERMDGMMAMGEAVKDITPMMRGKVDYDPQAVRAFSEEVRRHSGTAMTRLFPEGSNGKPSEAKEAIWTDWEEFEKLAEQLHMLSLGLSEAADNGLKMAGTDGAATMDSGAMMGGQTLMGGQSMMGGQTMMGAGSMMNDMGIEELAEMPADGVFMMVSQTCAACHTKYRAEAK